MGGLFGGGGSSAPTYRYVDKYEYVDVPAGPDDAEQEASAAQERSKRDRLNAQNRYGTATHPASDLAGGQADDPYAL